MAKGKANTKFNYDKTTTSGGQSGTSGPDAIAQQRTTDIWNAANAAGGQVPSSVTNALGFLNGDPSAVNSYMNPYQQQVVDSYLANLKHANALSMNQVNDAATKAGAFGGSRQGVATGVALAENQRNTGAQVASLLAGGYDQATQRAQAAANLGMTAGSPDLWRLNLLKQGFSGMPYGTQYQNRNNQATTKAGGEFSGSLRVGI